MSTIKDLMKTAEKIQEYISRLEVNEESEENNNFSRIMHDGSNSQLLDMIDHLKFELQSNLKYHNEKSKIVFLAMVNAAITAEYNMYCTLHALFVSKKDFNEVYKEFKFLNDQTLNKLETIYKSTSKYFT